MVYGLLYNPGSTGKLKKLGFFHSFTLSQFNSVIHVVSLLLPALVNDVQVRHPFLATAPAHAHVPVQVRDFLLLRFLPSPFSSLFLSNCHSPCFSVSCFLQVVSFYSSVSCSSAFPLCSAMSQPQVYTNHTTVLFYFYFNFFKFCLFLFLPRPLFWYVSEFLMALFPF